MSDPKQKPPSLGLSMVVGVVLGQVGCLTVAVIFAALLAGLWLDNHFQSRPIFTILLFVASVPVTVAMMFVVVRRATARFAASSASTQETPSQEDGSGEEQA